MSKASGSIDLKSTSTAAKTATNYLEFNSTNGLKIAGSNPSTTTTNYIQITSTGVRTVYDQYNYSLLDSNGLHIYQGTSSAQKVATFSAVMAGYVKTTIGNKTENNLAIEGGSLTPARIFFNTGNTERGRITSYDTSGGLTIAGFGRTSITSCGSDINEIKSEVVCSSTQVTIGVGNTTYQELYCTGNINIASGSVYKINGNPLTASDVGAVPTSRTVNSKALSSDISLAASDVGAVPTSRTVNSKALSSNISLTASDVGAVPTTRTVNSKALSSNISLSASDVGAVPTTRTVNSKALSSDISLTASDVSAVPTSDVSTTGGNNKVIKSDSSGNITITGNISTGHAPSTGQIGEIIKDEPSAVSTQSGKYYQLASVSLTPGVWVYTTTAEFAANTSGYRRAYTTTTSFTNGTSTAPTVIAKALATNVAQAGGQVTHTHDAMIFTVTTNTTYRLVAYQNGGNLSVTGRIYAVRIA